MVIHSRAMVSSSCAMQRSVAARDFCGCQWVAALDHTQTARYRYNFSLSKLLSSSGFVRGPMRQLYTEVDAHAVPWFGGYQNIVIVHTRCALP